MKTGFAVAVAALLAAGCSSSATDSGSTPSQKPSKSAYAPAVGDDAALLAGHIPGCTDAASGDIAGGGPDMTSTATCTLSGHLVIIDAFTSGDSLETVPTLLKGTETYYASGDTGWLAFLADQGADATTTTMQEQLTNAAGDLLREGTDGDPHVPASLNAQQQLAAVIAKALGGTVGHVPG